jgi:hypothetical protein
MERTLIAVAGVISIVAVAAFSEKLGLAAPLSLVIVGIGLSYVPGVPRIRVEPEHAGHRLGCFTRCCRGSAGRCLAERFSPRQAERSGLSRNVGRVNALLGSVALRHDAWG